MKISFLFGILLVQFISTSVCDNGDSHKENICRGKVNHHGFTIIDYAVVGIMLLISCIIGMFYGFFGKKQKTSTDFLLGGSEMGTLPMSLSLAASFVTAIELLGNPAEMYKFGTQFWTIVFAFLFVTPITTQFYLPVFMKLRLTSSFEYLEMRFNKQVRLFAAFIYALQMTLYTSVTVYAPAIALSHVTGMGVILAVSIVYIVCVFYSSQGGMKAVIMTDTFQAAVLMISLFAIVILGQLLVGSVSDVYNIALKSGRIELFKFNPSLTERHTIWTQVLGGVAYWIPMFCSNQSSIQKYLSVKTIKQVRIAIWVSAFSLVIIYTINFYTGMIMFAQYYECDPLNRIFGKSTLNSDEILPYYVMHVLSRYNGVPGLFVAGIFAASLGTVASALNSLAAITIKDFLEAGLNFKVANNKGAILSKWISVIFGAFSFLLIFIVKQIDSVLKAALTFNGIIGGINLGLFTLGMFIPWINAKGALMGSIISIIFVSWLGINSQIAETEGYISEFDKPMFNPNCTNCPEFQVMPLESNTKVFVLFRISYMWYSAIGLVMTMTIGALISWFTGFHDPCRVSPDLLSPPMRNLYSSLSKNVKEKLKLPIETKEEIQVSQTRQLYSDEKS